MGAFDSELYALGYRFRHEPKQKTEREKFDEVFVGPKWSGKCVGFCSSSSCRPCPSNNREGPEYFQNQLKWTKRDIEFWLARGYAKEATLRRQRFENIFPGVWK